MGANWPLALDGMGVSDMKEDAVQKQCVEWCRWSIKKDVFYWSTPNERKPSQNMQGLKDMGLKTGVADLTFIYNDGELRNLYIEVKRPTTYKTGKRGDKIISQRGGTQSPNQILFQADVEAVGATYHLIDNLDDFAALMERYKLVRTIK